jgi:hypothetical protein
LRATKPVAFDLRIVELATDAARADLETDEPWCRHDAGTIEWIAPSPTIYILS